MQSFRANRASHLRGDVRYVGGASQNRVGDVLALFRMASGVGHRIQLTFDTKTPSMASPFPLVGDAEGTAFN